jgi:hypothetical protein
VRFVTWNLWAGDTQAKLGQISPTPDLRVFCEVSKVLPSSSPSEPAPAWAWEGRLLDRGVAVASWSETMQRVEPFVETDGLRGIAGRSGGLTVAALASGVVNVGAAPQ